MELQLLRSLRGSRFKSLANRHQVLPAFLGLVGYVIDSAEIVNSLAQVSYQGLFALLEDAILIFTGAEEHCFLHFFIYTGVDNFTSLNTTMVPSETTAPEAVFPEAKVLLVDIF